jgi:acyl carrier protein
MTTLKDRVADCFCALFPNHSREELLTASRESIPEWDSLAGVTLLTLLEQELHINFDLSEIEHLNSVAAVLNYVSTHSALHGQRHDQ